MRENNPSRRNDRRCTRQINQTHAGQEERKKSLTISPNSSNRSVRKKKSISIRFVCFVSRWTNEDRFCLVAVTSLVEKRTSLRIVTFLLLEFFFVRRATSQFHYSCEKCSLLLSIIIDFHRNLVDHRRTRQTRRTTKRVSLRKFFFFQLNFI